jgi:hypothetical protein
VFSIWQLVCYSSCREPQLMLTLFLALYIFQDVCYFVYYRLVKFTDLVCYIQCLSDCVYSHLSTKWISVRFANCWLFFRWCVTLAMKNLSLCSITSSIFCHTEGMLPYMQICYLLIGAGCLSMYVILLIKVIKLIFIICILFLLACELSLTWKVVNESWSWFGGGFCLTGGM